MEEKVYHSNYQVEKTYWWFTARAHIISTLINHYCKIEKQSDVIDIGCGTGGFLEILAKDYKAVGTDTSELAIEYCQKRGLDVQRCTLDTFKKNGRKIQLAVMLDVVEHIENDSGVVRQVYDLLEPGGYFVASVPAYQWLWSAHDVIHMHYRRYTKRTFRDLLENVGFTSIKFSYFNTFLFPLAALKRLTQKNTDPKNIRSIVDPVPSVLNIVFDKIFSAESTLLKKISLPFGVSVVAICRKGF